MAEASLTGPVGRRAGAGERSRNYVLGLLCALNVLLVLDKIVLTILVEPIRQEFQLSDLQLGTLLGLSYAIFMGAAGLPLGWLADRANRRNLAAACLAVWSVMTAACGVAQNLTQLLLARIGVGIAEAGGGPAAVSMISDLFAERRRSTAMAVFAMGGNIAVLFNLMIITKITFHYGWRASLIAASVPGVVVALVLLFTIKEPRRGLADGLNPNVARPPLATTLRFIAGQRSLVHLIIGATVSYIVIAGMGSWHFAFLVRSYSVKLNEVGPILGLGLSVLGATFGLTSGYLADRLAARDERYRLWLIAGGSAACFFVGVPALTVVDWHWAVSLAAVFGAMVTFWFAATTALGQALVQLRMRATLAGLFFLLSNMVGFGVGPLAIGALSDALAPSYGNESLRYAMLIAVCLNLWAALHFFLAARHVARDLQKARSAQAAAKDAGVLDPEGAPA